MHFASMLEVGGSEEQILQKTSLDLPRYCATLDEKVMLGTT
jgi:hypothetical protein